LDYFRLYIWYPACLEHLSVLWADGHGEMTVTFWQGTAVGKRGGILGHRLP
jgi:hypothetical protein